MILKETRMVKKRKFKMKKKINSKYFLSVSLCSLFALGLFLPLNFSRAIENSGGLSLSPAHQEVVISAQEKSKSFLVKAENKTDEKQKINLSFSDFESRLDSNGIMFSKDNDSKLAGSYSLASWLKTEKTEFILDPNSEVEVEIILENNEALSPGGHYGAVLLSFSPEKSDAETIKIQQSLAALIFAKKIGGEKYSMRLEKIDFRKNFFAFPPKINLEFKNDGNTHIVPRGIIKVNDFFGRSVARGVINQESAIILPEVTRSINNKLNINSKILFPGNYKLKIAYRFDGKDEFENLESGFFYAGSIGFWLIISLTILILSATIRRYRKNKKAEINT
jgi:hypothetical protein